jgi:hypothetical protein
MTSLHEGTERPAVRRNSPASRRPHFGRCPARELQNPRVQVRRARYDLARRSARARRLVWTNAKASHSVITLPRFRRWARTNAGDSWNRTTLPSTMAVADISRAYAKRPRGGKQQPEIREQLQAPRLRENIESTRAAGQRKADTVPPHRHADTDTRNRGVNDPWAALGVTLQGGRRGRSRLGSVPALTEPQSRGGAERRPHSRRAVHGLNPCAFCAL